MRRAKLCTAYARNKDKQGNQRPHFSCSVHKMHIADGEVASCYVKHAATSLRVQSGALTCAKHRHTAPAESHPIYWPYVSQEDPSTRWQQKHGGWTLSRVGIEGFLELLYIVDRRPAR